MQVSHSAPSNVNHFESHLNSLQQTIDGNFHANKYIKNTDPDDVSLFKGKSYFPDDYQFRDYLRNLPGGDVFEEVRPSLPDVAQ